MEKKSKKKQDKKPLSTEEELMERIFGKEERTDCQGMRIYISLPISGYDIDERIERARFICTELMRLFPGCKFFNPLKTLKKVPEGEPLPDWEWFMAHDLPSLYHATHVYFDEKWETSKGCRLEHAIVEQQDGKIITLPLHL